MSHVRSQLDAYLKSYDTAARRNRIGYLAIRITNVLLAGMVALFALGDGVPGLSPGRTTTLVGVFGITITTLESLNTLLQLHTRWLSYRTGWRDVERLRDDYEGLVAPFDGKDREKELAVAYNTIRDREFSSWYSSARAGGTGSTGSTGTGRRLPGLRRRPSTTPSSRRRMTTGSS